MKFFKNIFIIVILFSMNIYARPPWDQGPNNRTYRATANIYVEDVNGNPVFNISGTFHFKMSFDTDGDGCVDEDDPLAYKFETGNFTTDQQGSAFVELFITVPIEWYNGWKHVYVDDLSGQINGVNISISECNNTQSNTYFDISPNYVVIPDGDKDNISDNIESQLAEKFSPVIHRHPNDRQQNLENIETLMCNSPTKLKAWNLGGMMCYNSDILPLHIVDYNSEGWIFKNSYGWGSETPGYEFWRIDFNINKSSSYSGASNGNRPIYYHIYKYENKYYIQYWYFFTMNDLRGDTNNDTWHEGDWEHVGIKLNSSLTPVAVNFYQHYGGHTRYPNECWWSSTNSTSSTPLQGYCENSRTHLHIWISKNGHASYNKNDKVYRIQAYALSNDQWETEDFKDQCDYETNQSSFEYDYMKKLGEIEWSEQWLGYFPKGNSKPWLPFIGNVGEFWRISFPDGISTPSPRMPPFRRGYYSFTVNSSESGFGNKEEDASLYLHINGFYRAGLGPDIPLIIGDGDISWEQNDSGL